MKKTLTMFATPRTCQGAPLHRTSHAPHLARREKAGT
jgi:hypothetical protein